MASVIYQLKIKFEERNTVVFLEPEEIPFIDFSSLVEKIKRTLPRRYQVLSVEQIRLKYLDDEQCFVELSGDQYHCIADMFRCAVAVENADFKRITLQLEINDSPIPPYRPVGKRPISTSSNPSPTSLPSRYEKEQRRSVQQQPKASRRLETLFAKPAEVSTSKLPQLANLAPLSCEQSTSIFKSPLEKYIEHQQNNLDALKEKECQLSGWILEYTNLQKSSAAEQNRSGPMCGNCHRREKHNRLNCPYHGCTSFFHCGDLSKHSEEKATVKDLEKQHKDVVREIKSLENELTLKKQSISSIQDRYIYKVKKNLIESNPSKYLTAGVDGSYVENWFLLNKDSKKLEHLCVVKAASQQHKKYNTF